MNTVINISDKLKIKTLEMKIDKLRFELDAHITNSYNVRSENLALMSKNDRLREENEELKRLLKAVEIEIVYE